uniref:Uncharacterized protein n=1 Tax=Plectus sambesii TaxID=2011161 RepID=A0A914V8F5_9BILA
MALSRYSHAKRRYYCQAKRLRRGWGDNSRHDNSRHGFFCDKSRHDNSRQSTRDATARDMNFQRQLATRQLATCFFGDSSRHNNSRYAFSATTRDTTTRDMLFRRQLAT